MLRSNCYLVACLLYLFSGCDSSASNDDSIEVEQSTVEQIQAIPDTSIYLLGSALELDLSDYFVSRDRGPIDFSLISANTAMTLEAQAESVSIKPERMGADSVFVSVNDVVVDTFYIRIQPFIPSETCEQSLEDNKFHAIEVVGQDSIPFSGEAHLDIHGAVSGPWYWGFELEEPNVGWSLHFHRWRTTEAPTHFGANTHLTLTPDMPTPTFIDFIESREPFSFTRYQTSQWYLYYEQPAEEFYKGEFWISLEDINEPNSRIIYGCFGAS